MAVDDLIDELGDLWRDVPDEEIAAAQAEAVALADTLRRWAAGDPMVIPTPSGNVLRDAAGLVGAAADSTRAKRLARAEAIRRAKAVAQIVGRAAIRVALG